MMPKLALSLLVCFLSGFFAVSLLWPRRLNTAAAVLVRLCLAYGFGAALSSCWFFLWLCVGGAHDAFPLTFILPEILITALLGYLCFRRGFALSEPPFTQSETSNVDGLGTLLLGAIFGVVLLFAIGSFIFIALRSPHGEFDAVSIWNLRARFLARGTAHWRDAFSDSLSLPHPDYPLLLPTTVARLWKYLGTEALWAPMSAAFLITFSSLGVVCSSLALLRNKQVAYLAGIVVLGVNMFVALGAWQYADTTVGLFILSTLILTAIYDSAPKRENSGLLVLAGATAAFCAWTKNEGQLFLLVFVVTRLCFSLLRQGWKASISEGTAIMAGVLPVLAVIAYFKLAVTPANYFLLAGNDSSGPMRYFLEPGTVAQKVADPTRYRIIAQAIVEQVLRFGARKTLGITPLLVLYVVLVGVYKTSIIKIEDSAAILLLMLAGYFVVYLTTPLVLVFQLQTSLSRLLLQLWPSAVFVLFMATSSQESTNAIETYGVRSFSAQELPVVKVS